MQLCARATPCGRADGWSFFCASLHTSGLDRDNRGALPPERQRASHLLPLRDEAATGCGGDCLATIARRPWGRRVVGEFEGVVVK